MEPAGALLSASGLVLVIYMAVLVGIGVWASRRTRSESGFLLGDRSMGPVVAGLAYAASTSSAWVLIGYTGFVANIGLSALWIVPGILAGYGVVWFGLGPFLNRVSREEGRLTVLDIVAGHAVGPTRWAIKAIAAAMILFCFSFYIAAQFQGAGAALADLFAIKFETALVVGAVIVLAYTFMGGFWAVSLTDTLQGACIALIAIVLPVAAVVYAGGVSGVVSGLSAQPASFSAPFGDYAGLSAAGFVLGAVALGFGALGQPHLLAWIMATRDKRARRQGAVVSIGWGVLVYTGMTIVALAARAAIGSTAPMNETVIFEIAQHALPEIFSALVYAAIISAIMSTVDSQLLTASAAISHDLGVKHIAPGREVWVTRIAIMLLCGVAIVLTLNVPASIFDRVLFAWTALGAAFGPTLVARAMGKQPHGAAVLLAIIVGFGLAVGFNQFWGSGPGAWRERIVPWIAGVAIVFLAPQLASNVKAK